MTIEAHSELETISAWLNFMNSYLSPSYAPIALSALEKIMSFQFKACLVDETQKMSPKLIFLPILRRQRQNEDGRRTNFSHFLKLGQQREKR